MRTGDDIMRESGKYRNYSNYAMALLVFAAVMVMMNGSSILITVATAAAGAVLDGYSGRGRAYYFLFENINLYTALVYMITTVPLLLWYYFAFVEKRGGKAFWKSQTKQLTPVSFLWMIPTAFFAHHAVSFLMTAVSLVLPSAMRNYTEMVETSGFSDYSLLWAAATLILAPLMEETVFRGMIYGYLRRAGAGFVAANLIQAVLFGVYHMNLIQGIYAALAGFLLGYLAHRYQSLIIPMVFHSVFNLFGTALAEWESNVLPDLLLMVMILASVPLLAAVIAMIQLRVGEKKTEERE